jgi:hypothetical protein
MFKGGVSMKRRDLSVLFLAVMLLCLTPRLFAQSSADDHVHLGVYGNLFRLSDSRITLGGVGGRVSIKVWSKVQLEAESAYNFDQVFSQGFSDSTGTLTVSRTHVRVLDGLFGPKVFTNKGPVRLFGVLKGGFINFNLTSSPAVTIQTVNSAFQGLNRSNIFGVLYPGGGAEAFWGPIGVRIDVGDEIFFHSGTHHNLRASFGPVLRF